MRPLERHGEQRAVQALEARGWRCYKQNGLGRASRPDRLLLGPGGTHGFMEFKREGARPTKLQWLELDALWAMGHSVAVGVTAADAIAFTDMLRLTRGPVRWLYWERR